MDVLETGAPRRRCVTGCPEEERRGRPDAAADRRAARSGVTARRAPAGIPVGLAS